MLSDEPAIRSATINSNSRRGKIVQRDNTDKVPSTASADGKARDSKLQGDEEVNGSAIIRVMSLTNYEYKEASNSCKTAIVSSHMSITFADKI